MIGALLRTEGMGGGAAISVTDTNSIDFTLSGTNVSGDLRISTNAADTGYSIVALDVQSASSVGLRAQILNTLIAYRVTSLQTLSASATITVDGKPRQICLVTGNGGAITIDTTTGLTTGTFDGQEVVLEGRSNTNTVTVTSAGNVSTNGTCVLGLGDSLTLFWDATSTVWREQGRSS